MLKVAYSTGFPKPGGAPHRDDIGLWMAGVLKHFGEVISLLLAGILLWFRGDTKPGRPENLKCRLVCDLASVVGHQQRLRFLYLSQLFHLKTQTACDLYT